MSRRLLSLRALLPAFAYAGPDSLFSDEIRDHRELKKSNARAVRRAVLGS